MGEVYFKIKHSTPLKKLMEAYCEKQGKQLNSVRFLFDGNRVQPTDTPMTVRLIGIYQGGHFPFLVSFNSRSSKWKMKTRSRS
jgi:hypothetical protein